MEEQNLSPADYQRLLNVTIDLGHFLLEAGAEIYRVEESIQRVLYAYGIKHVDVFAIPNNITVTITMADDTCFTRLRRIYSRGTNYQMIEDLNALSRYICENRPSVDEIRGYLKQIHRRKTYAGWLMLLGYMGVALAFTLFFGGTGDDALVAAAAGAMVWLAIRLMEQVHTNVFFINLVGSMLVTLLAILAVRYQLAQHSDSVIIGTLMTLVPGVAFTNALRDIIAGDFMAGIMKAVEALLIALALALGTGVALIMTGGI